MNQYQPSVQRKGGYKEVITIALPLILSTGAWTLQYFIDRMFLAWYSPQAIAAAMPAGMFCFTIMSLFLGTAGYSSTFVAQYFGASRNDRIGPSVWQGIYVAIIGGLVLGLFIPIARPLFHLAGHAPDVQELEVIYFQILTLGSFPVIACSALGGFFSGRGRPWPIMWISSVGTVINLVLDYTMIFGKWGFPEMGIKGAGIATVISSYVSLAIYLGLEFRDPYERLYSTVSGWRFDCDLFSRLVRYGLPSGVEFFLDIGAFSMFILIVGRLGTMELASTNIAFNINNLAFMPMIGFGMAVSVLVGKYLGMDRPDIAERSVYSGFKLTFVYMLFVAIAYVLVPDVFIMPFTLKADATRFKEIHDITVVLLRFVALYSIFDTMNIIFASAIKGAGDTKYIMIMILVLSLALLVIPVYIGVVLLHKGIYIAWSFATLYVIVLGISFLMRFRGGRWRGMRVIRETPEILPPSGLI